MDVNVLSVSGLCKTYPGFQLKDVGFSVREGSIMGFIGRNGAGKTTTLKSLLNFVHPDSGEIIFFDKIRIFLELAHEVGWKSVTLNQMQECYEKTCV